ncbi:wall-associated protein [Stenotrophomonas sp. MH1]|uniref:Wall-associated protein n=1 Tax=Stenotrophomonas capsici TaxID=3110230 RepID=A0ABU5V3Y6_9GAMM|nr:wall-associated protein [Stenotrophomonas sp. MH1]MEA5668061.1 wall-associated protein [Stenotrophomonas sp. MH1]
MKVFGDAGSCLCVRLLISTWAFMILADNVQAQSYSRTETITYHDNNDKWVLGQVASRTVNGVVAEQASYDPNTALPLQSWSFGKLKQTLTYNADGTVATVKDGNNNVTTLSNWKRGIPQAISYADGTTQAAVVNDRGWITQVTDQNGSATNYGYDAMGRLAQTNFPAGDSVSWNVSGREFRALHSGDWKPAGVVDGQWRLQEVTGNHITYTYYDALWRPVLRHNYDISNIGGTLQSTSTEYDAKGRVVFQSYPSSDLIPPAQGTWTFYDVLDRPTQVKQDSEHGLLVTTTAYLSDGNGAYILVTTPRGGETRTWYQMFDQPSYDAPVRITQPEGAITTIARDVLGKPTSITRGNADGTTSATRTYRYNAYQELCASVEPETGATLIGYDAAGNLAWSAAGLAATTACESDGSSSAVVARRVIRGYDNRNQLMSLTFPDGSGNQTWTYTPDGLPSQIITQDVASATQAINTYTYNKRRLLTAETVGQSGGYNWALGYGYDANGSLAGVQYPSGLYVDYAPNALGQPTRAGSYATGVSYYPNGGMSQFVYGNGITHTMQQNGRQLPARVKDGVVLDTTYGYDANSNVTQITDALDSARTRSMSYDGLDRLAQATSPSFGGGGQITYSYDALDNLRTTKLTGVKQYNYWYDAANRLTNIIDDGGATVIGLAYDAQGNLANKNGQTFQFDYGNRLRNAVGKEIYRYDGHGRRVVSWSPSQGNIISMYGQDGVLRRQDNDRKANSIEYVYLNGSLIAKISTSTAPAAPVITVPAYSDNGSFTVSWNAITSATNYEVQEQFNGGAWQAAYSGSALSIARSGKAGGLYGYRGRACRNAICSGWGATASVSVQAIPSGASTLSAPAFSNSGSYTVSWTGVSGAAKYKLEESTNGGSWTLIGDSPALSLAIVNRANGTYSYRVNSCNAAGCGTMSSSINVRVLHPPASAPQLSVPSTSTNGSYTITWSMVSTATSYQLEESAPGSGWASVYSGGGNSHTISGKGNGSHAYRVKACNEGGCSGYSQNASVSVLLPPAAAPTLSVPATNSTGAYNVSWTAVGLATSYRLEESINGGAWALIHDEGATNRSLNSKATASYRYRVKACNSSGCSGWSAEVMVSVMRIPDVPSNAWGQITSSSRSQWKISASWSAVPGATRYELTGYFGYNGPDTTSFMIVRSVSSPTEDMPFQVRACNDSGCSPWSTTFYASL